MEAKKAGVCSGWSHRPDLAGVGQDRDTKPLPVPPCPGSALHLGPIPWSSISLPPIIAWCSDIHLSTRRGGCQSLWANPEASSSEGLSTQWSHLRYLSSLLLLFCVEGKAPLVLVNLGNKGAILHC